LIVAAIVMAMIYGVMCRREPAEQPKSSAGDAADGGPAE
jgi:hypothetical protein